jgi:hypothetical protein
MATKTMEARAMAAWMAAKAHYDDNNSNATKPAMMLTLTTTRIPSKRMTTTRTTGERKAAVAVIVATANQRICCPVPLPVLDNAGAATIVIFVPWPPLSMSLLDKRRMRQLTTARKRWRNERRRHRRRVTQSLMIGGGSLSCRKKFTCRH